MIMKPTLCEALTVMDQQKLQHLPIGLFASVMGVAGLTLMWTKVSEIVSPAAKPVALSLGWLTSILLVVLLIAYGLKTWRYQAAVSTEFKHPIKLNFFAAIPIGLILVATIWSNHQQGVATVLWWVGVTLMLVTTLVTMSSWLNHDHYQLGHLNPAWFIPVVGNVLVPIAGARLGQTEVSWFFFSIGIVFWLILMTVVINRLIFHDTLPDRFKPTLFILLAPPAVAFVAYVSLNGGQLDAFARVLYYSGLFLALLLASNALRFLALPFFVSAWAYSFPVAAIGIASFKQFELTDDGIFLLLGYVFLITLSALVPYLFYKTVRSLVNGQLLAPEES